MKRLEIQADRKGYTTWCTTCQGHGLRLPLFDSPTVDVYSEKMAELNAVAHEKALSKHETVIFEYKP